MANLEQYIHFNSFAKAIKYLAEARASVVVLLIACLLLPAASFAAAQKPHYKGTITTDSVRLVQRGDFLHIDFDIVFTNVKLKSQHGVTLTPILATATDTLMLPEVLVKGNNEYLAYERELTLMSKRKKEKLPETYKVKRGNHFKNDTLTYRYLLPYSPWMAGANADLMHDKCGCGKSALMEITSIGTITPQPMPYTVVPHLAYIMPEAEKVKRREIQVETFLDFEVNKTFIRPEYMNNPRELAKIYRMIDDLHTDKDIEINSLDIIGYASPEGTLANNKRLSEGRAKALRDYLAAQYDFPREIYHIEFGGENWKGLTTVLDTITLAHKDEVMEILTNTADPDARKLKLQKLRNGEPYRYLLKNYYPRLRVAICKAEYNVRNFDIHRAKEVIKTRPQNLSLNEMFLVANTYEEGSQEFIDVFETAVRMYPADEVANLNAASSAIQRRDLTSAERYLGRVNPDNYPAEYNNATGLLALLNGEYELAISYFNLAAKHGSEAAKSNLEEAKKKQENERILTNNNKLEND